MSLYECFKKLRKNGYTIKKHFGIDIRHYRYDNQLSFVYTNEVGDNVIVVDIQKELEKNNKQQLLILLQYCGFKMPEINKMKKGIIRFM